MLMRKNLNGSMSTRHPHRMNRQLKIRFQAHISLAMSQTQSPGVLGSAAPRSSPFAIPRVITHNVVVTELSGIVSRIVADLTQKAIPSASNILSYASEVMQMIENIPCLNGAQKLTILLAVINTVIEHSSLTPDEKAGMISLVACVVPQFASLMCTATGGQFNLNKRSCFSCWGKRS